ncbi:cytochrome P450 [Mycobacterium sp. pUA109]|uniref:cytochrome P450 n=1 Tax=Mycobacterium sp. pUA109 TaxID=3238982 RepID=UPI00351B9834
MATPDNAELVEKLRNFSSDESTPAEAIELFADARERCPVAHSDKQGGFRLLLNYDDIKSAHTDWQTFASSPSVTRPFAERPAFPPLEHDPPEHTVWRELFSRVLNQDTAIRVEPVFRADVVEQIDKLLAVGTCDLVADFAEELPLLALCHLLGLAPEKRAAVRAKTLDMVGHLGDQDRAAATFMALAQLGVEEVLDRRENPRDDFLTELSVAELNGRLLTLDELTMTMSSFLVAGHGTTVAGMSSLLYEVLSSSETRARLIREPDLIRSAVEENLRLHPPFFGLFRRAVKPTIVHDVEIAEGESLLMCWAAANRDPKVYDEPDTFSLERKQSRRSRHLTFGFGIHSCPAAPIARMEMGVALEELLRRAPGTELKDPASVRFEFRGTETAAIPSLPATVRG